MGAKRGQDRGRSTRCSRQLPVVGQPTLAQRTGTSDTTLENPGTDKERWKRSQREPPSTAPLSDAHETSKNSSHSLTKDDIPTIVEAVIRALPNTSLSQERTPTGPSSPLGHENSSTGGAQALTDTQERDHLPPPGDNFNCF